MNKLLVSRVVELSNGIALPCVEHGDRDGLPLLLLHGYTDSWRSFEPVLPLFTDDLRAIAITQRGHGDASKPAEGYTPADFASDAVAVLDALGIERAVVCGHSLGSFVAQRIALDHPDRVAGLILVGSFPKMRGNAAAEALWQTGVKLLTEPIERPFAAEFQAGTVAKPIAPDLLDLFIDESLKTPVFVWRAALEAALETDHSDELPGIQTPTLLVWGAQDAIFTRSDQDILLGCLPNARLLVYEDVGHAVHWEAPERFVRDVTDFVQATATRRDVA